jgi:site-specific DNA-methyltransferase (adenine-specific)
VVIPDTLTALAVPVASLRPYGRNPRRGDVGAIRASLEAHGQYRPIVARVGSGEVLAGNHTLAAAVELGWQEVAATFVDVDDDEAARIVLVDNRTADLGVYDDEQLAELLGSLSELDGTGWEPIDLDRMLAQLEQPGVDTDPVPLPAEPTTRLGDLWVLGDHRLLCGDTTDGAVATVVAGETVEVLWTDHQKGVDYVGKTADALTITNDQRVGLSGLLTAAFAAVDEVLAAGGRFYCAGPAGPQGLVFRQALVDVGWRLHQVLVWAKDVFVLGHSDYHYQHEDVLYGFKPGPGRPGRGRHDGSRWYGDHAASTLFTVDRPKRSSEHPTMKPVELIARQLINSSVSGDAVLDPFCGAGSTLIACENLGRRCYAVELDPRYVDVIVDRWQRHTGLEATRG